MPSKTEINKTKSLSEKNDTVQPSVKQNGINNVCSHHVAVNIDSRYQIEIMWSVCVVTLMITDKGIDVHVALYVSISICNYSINICALYI